MADQVETQSAETTAVETTVEQPATQDSTTPAEGSPFADYEAMLSKYNVAPASTQETPDGTTTETTTEQAAQEQTDDGSETTNSETADVDDFEIPKIKWNGEEKDLREVVKTNPDIISELEKRFDYTQKTQTLSKEREDFTKTKEEFDAQAKYLVLQNIALEVGGNPKAEPIFDPYAEKNGEVKDGFAVYSDRESFMQARKEYSEFAGKYQTYQQNVERTNRENAELVKQFEDKYKGVKTDELIKNMMDYVNPSITKGQLPFPKDALEIFYLGKNHERILKDKLNNVKKEKEAEYKKGYNDALAETKKNGSKPKSTASSVKVAAKPDKEAEGWDAYEDMKNKYLLKK